MDLIGGMMWTSRITKFVVGCSQYLREYAKIVNSGLVKSMTTNVITAKMPII